MNTEAPYERRLDRALPEFTPTVSLPTTPEVLAVHRDPSTPQAVPPGREPVRPTIAWVRPSEVPTLIGARWVGRGIDLQTELTRRGRRAPAAAATEATRRVIRPAIGRPQSFAPPANRSEGLEL